MSTPDRHTDLGRPDLPPDLGREGYTEPGVGPAPTTSAGPDTASREDYVDHPSPGRSAAPAAAPDRAAPADTERREQLVPRERADAYSARWDAVKGTFVDEPRRAVTEADQLVGELLDELQELFRRQRQSLEHGLDADETSTEDLRLALRRYRSFFDRLLSL